MDNQQETKNFILLNLNLKIKQENKKQLFNYIFLHLIITVLKIKGKEDKKAKKTKQNIKTYY